VATGATDRVLPVPGWTLPGVYTLGGAQVALKFQACAIGQRVVFMGTGPLLYLVAYQYAKAGVTVAAVLDTARLAKTSSGPCRDAVAARPCSPRGVLRRPGCARTAWPAQRRAAAARAGRGEGRVAGVAWHDGNGEEQRTLACDAVGFGYALRSETQLADLLGCRFAYAPCTAPTCPSATRQGAAACRACTWRATAPASWARTRPSGPANARRWRCCKTPACDRHRARRRGSNASCTKLLGFRQGAGTRFSHPRRWAAQRRTSWSCAAARTSPPAPCADGRPAGRQRTQPLEGAVARRHGPMPGPHVRRGGGRDPGACHAASRCSWWAGCAGRRRSSRSLRLAPAEAERAMNRHRNRCGHRRRRHRRRVGGAGLAPQGRGRGAAGARPVRLALQRRELRRRAAPGPAAECSCRWPSARTASGASCPR
jgi:hypothetical protein